MKGGFLNNKKGLSTKKKEEEDAKKASGGKQEWTDELRDKMVVVFQNTLKGKPLADLERRVREGTGAEDGARHLGCGQANDTPLVAKEEAKKAEKEKEATHYSSLCTDEGCQDPNCAPDSGKADGGCTEEGCADPGCGHAPQEIDSAARTIDKFEK